MEQIFEWLRMPLVQALGSCGSRKLPPGVEEPSSCSCAVTLPSPSVTLCHCCHQSSCSAPEWGGTAHSSSALSARAKVLCRDPLLVVGQLCHPPSGHPESWELTKHMIISSSVDCYNTWITWKSAYEQGKARSILYVSLQCMLLGALCHPAGVWYSPALPKALALPSCPPAARPGVGDHVHQGHIPLDQEHLGKSYL